MQLIDDKSLDAAIAQIPNTLAKGILFTGDRRMCVDEGIGIFEQEKLLGLVTIAPYGECHNGQPTIVGLWVRQEYRCQGIGRKLLEAAILRCQERGFTEKIRVEAITEPVNKLWAKIPEEIKRHCDFHNLVMFPGMEID